MIDQLFTPTAIGAIPAANRIVMAPLTRALADNAGVPTPLAADYYAQRASAGLIIAEATNISPQGRGYTQTPGMFSDEHVAAWELVTSAVHEAGGRIILQLWHTGRFSHAELHDGAPPVAPSAIQADELTFLGPDRFERPSMPRALETGEIAGIIADYARAARNAVAAGFDGVEVHSANCYLLDQFIRDSTNIRSDRYGGSVENRTRLTFEVCEAVAAAIGADRTGVRLSPITRSAGDTPFDSTPQETYGFLAKRLGTLNLAYLHCIEGQTRGDNAHDAFDFQALRRAFGGAYIANNGFTRALAIEAIAANRADMIAFGRPFITNPDLVERLAADAPLAPEAEKALLYGGAAHGYTDWPTMAVAQPPV